MNALEAEGVAVQRGAREVLHGVSLRLSAGEGLALVGPNAAGKSTLLRALAGLLPLRAGGVRLFGRPLSTLSRASVARAVAVVVPDDGNAGALSVAERVALGRYPHRGPFHAFDEDDRTAVRRALERTGLAELRDRPLFTLSDGERQRAALARALAQEPRVLLLDEPAAHLDVGHQLALFRVLDEVRQEGVAVLAVVHDLQRAADWAGRLALLHQGRLLADGRPHEVLKSAACAEAFGVHITPHVVSGRAQPLYGFEMPGGAPSR